MHKATFASIFLLAQCVTSSVTVAFSIGTSNEGEFPTAFFARDAGFCKAEGVECDIVATGASGITGSLASGRFDAITYSSPAIKETEAGRLCAKMVYPFVHMFSQAIVGKVKTVEELAGRAISTYEIPSLSDSAVKDVLRSTNVDGFTISHRSFTADRVKAVINDEKVGGVEVFATHASNPEATYVRGVKGMYSIVPIGDPRHVRIIVAGMFVRCEDLIDANKRAAIKKVVKAMHEASRVILDPVHKKTVVAWIQKWLGRKFHGTHGMTFEGKSVSSFTHPGEPLTLEEASLAIYESVQAFVADRWPPFEVRERTVRSMLRNDWQGNVSQFYDTTVLEELLQNK